MVPFPLNLKFTVFRLVFFACACVCTQVFHKGSHTKKDVNWVVDNGESFGNGTIVYVKKKVTQILWMIRVLQRFSMFSLSAELYSLFIISYDKPHAVSIGYEHKRRPPSTVMNSNNGHEVCGWKWSTAAYKLNAILYLCLIYVKFTISHFPPFQVCNDCWQGRLYSTYKWVLLRFLHHFFFCRIKLS